MADNEDVTPTTDEVTTNSEATIYDDLRKEYDTYKDTSAAAVAQLQAELAKERAEKQAVMAHNYELVTAISNTPDPTASNIDQGSEPKVEVTPLFTYDD